MQKLKNFKRAAISFRDRITKTPLERSVAEACNNENYSAPVTLLQEISEKSFHPRERKSIMNLVWRYLDSSKRKWRRIYKTLTLIEYLLKFGSNSCISEIKEEEYRIRILQDFTYREDKIERGSGIREKAKYISRMTSDPWILNDEREKAHKEVSKFVGISSQDVHKGFAKDSSGSSYNSFHQEAIKPVEKEPPQQPVEEPAPKSSNVTDIFKPIILRPKTPNTAKPEFVFPETQQPTQLKFDIEFPEPQKTTEAQEHPPKNQIDINEAFNNLWTQQPPPQQPNTHQHPQPAMEINFNEPTMSQLKSNPQLNTQPLEESKEPTQPKDLESKLFDLDDLSSSQPKLQDQIYRII